MTKERKTNRKSPRARVGQADLGLARFRPSTSQWGDLESCLEKELSESDRTVVMAAIDEYNSWFYAERNAAFVDNTIAAVRRAKILLGELGAILGGSGLPKFEYNSLFAARSEINLQLANLQEGRLNIVTLNKTISILDDISVACALAERELSNGQGFVEGEIWSATINRLREYFRYIGAKVSVSNSTFNKQPFVEFIMQLSKIENGPSEHTSSIASLAKAIQVSAKKMKPSNICNTSEFV